jgi:UPF0716 protein FxsA
MLRILALLLLIPLLDALFLVFVATRIGAPLTVLLVVLTALIGMLLVRAEGRHTMRKIQQKVAQGEAPTNELLDGAFLLVAGGLLLTPGLVTDALGFILVIPLTRAPIRMVVRDYVVVPYMDRKTGGFATGNVYIGGSPFEQGGQGPGGQGPGGQGPGGNFPGGNVGGSAGDAGEAYDLDDDAYDVDVEDDSRSD